MDPAIFPKVESVKEAVDILLERFCQFFDNQGVKYIKFIGVEKYDCFTHEIHFVTPYKGKEDFKFRANSNGDIWIMCHRCLAPHYLSLPGTNIDLFIEMATTKVEKKRDNMSELIACLKEIVDGLEEMKPPELEKMNEILENL